MEMNQKLTYFTLYLAFFSSIVFSNEKYSFEDLEILAKNAEYQEFFDHAKDLRPTLRNEKWKKLVQASAEKFVQQKIQQKKFTENDFDSLIKLGQWSELKDEEFFNLKKNNFAINYFKQCFENNKKNCLEKIDSFWINAFKTPTLAKEIGDLIIKKNNDYKKAMSFYSFFTKKDLGEFYCKEEGFLNSSLKFLEERQNSLNNEKEFVSLYLENFSKECRANIEKFLSTQLSQFQKNWKWIFQVLSRNQKMFTESELDYYSFHYLLDNPEKGPTLNRSWIRIGQLAENFNRRQNLIKVLETHSILPDEFYKNPDQNYINALTHHLTKNFPEYFNIYAKTCVDYLQNKRKFEKGNPTIQCHNIFSKTEILNLLSPKIIKSYKQALN